MTPKLLQRLGDALERLYPTQVKKLQTTDFSQYAKYREDPVGFARDVLKVNFTPSQCRAAEACLKPPRRVLLPSGHELGKTILLACLALWWHCTRQPSVVLTTSPTKDNLKSILWKEIRSVAKRANLKLNFLPEDCRIKRAADDFVLGWVSSNPSAFHGWHGPDIAFLGDEGSGLPGWFLEELEGMFSPELGHSAVIAFNPIPSGTPIHLEFNRARRSGGWHIERLSCLEHPNVAEELAGRPPPVPQAMRLEKFDRLFRNWSNLVGCEIGSPNQLPTDIIWPPLDAIEFQNKTRRKPQVYRPGPLAEARLLGRYPRQGVASVWSDGDWMAASREGMAPLALDPYRIPEVGFDCARFGDDYSATHIRMGCKSLWHEEVNGQAVNESFERLKALAKQYAEWYNEFIVSLQLPQARRPQCITEFRIPFKIDDCGVGGAITDLLRGAGYNVIPINAQSKALDSESYPDRRSELWFGVALRARENRLDLSGLILDAKTGKAKVNENGEPYRLFPQEIVDELNRQAVAVTYGLDANARRVVVAKDELKKTLGRSPDSMDALDLAFAEEESEPGEGPSAVGRKDDPGLPWDLVLQMREAKVGWMGR